MCHLSKGREALRRQSRLGVCGPLHNNGSFSQRRYHICDECECLAREINARTLPGFDSGTPICARSSLLMRPEVIVRLLAQDSRQPDRRSERPEPLRERTPRAGSAASLIATRVKNSHDAANLERYKVMSPALYSKAYLCRRYPPTHDAHLTKWHDYRQRQIRR